VLKIELLDNESATIIETKYHFLDLPAHRLVYNRDLQFAIKLLEC